MGLFLNNKKITRMGDVFTLKLGLIHCSIRGNLYKKSRGAFI